MRKKIQNGKEKKMPHEELTATVVCGMQETRRLVDTNVDESEREGCPHRAKIADKNLSITLRPCARRVWP